MKIRCGFVSNSSSSSFILERGGCNYSRFVSDPNFSEPGSSDNTQLLERILWSFYIRSLWADGISFEYAYVPDDEFIKEFRRDSQYIFQGGSRRSCCVLILPNALKKAHQKYLSARDKRKKDPDTRVRLAQEVFLKTFLEFLLSYKEFKDLDLAVFDASDHDTTVDGDDNCESHASDLFYHQIGNFDVCLNEH